MPELTRIIEQLQQQNNRLNTQLHQLEKIETILIDNAVQNIKIVDLQTQAQVMWSKYDNLCSPNGIISDIQKHQANCPKQQINRLWWAMGVLASAFAGAITMYNQ